MRAQDGRGVESRKESASERPFVSEQLDIPWQEYQDIATGCLGYTPSLFWSLSLAEFLSAYRGYQRKQKEQYWHTGYVIATIRNALGGDHGRAVRATDVFPFLSDGADPDMVWSMEGYTEEEVEVEDDG